MDTQHESACGRRLDAGPATITLPEAGNRYMAIQVIDEDHYVYEVVYGSGAHTYTREQVGTRYVFAAVRTLVVRAREDLEIARGVRQLLG